ncbi:MAG TPA: protein tyrosine phosphatase [Methylovirgula sp.]|nr:protein tyrosine phosphatase [Methylovirgula sp.]
MSRIHVCSIFRIADVARATGARSLITLINREIRVDRPAAIAPERHLFVGISDITCEIEGHVLPCEEHVATLLDFVRGWDRADPLLIHCFAGVSRSTAAAFITACALSPHVEEDEIAQRLRRASPTATPNARLVSLADKLLDRKGRMIEAIEQIGRGEDCVEGEPFALELI